MSERENILTRIREALATPSHQRVPGGLPTVAEQRAVLPRAPEDRGTQIELFARNAAELRADFKPVDGWAAMMAALSGLAQAEGWRRVAAHRGAAARAAGGLGLSVVLTVADKQELAACDAAVTECDALVAQTGSVVVTSASAGGRALSCLPPHHVVLARRGQMTADLAAALDVVAQKYGARFPSMISFITGPSRTGDIERMLVLGAHGPKKLTIFLIDEL